jgi:hypothetical protein
MPISTGNVPKALSGDTGMAKKHWMAGAVKHPGALHRELGVAEGKKIPAKKMAKAAHSKSPKVRKMVGLAKAFAHAHHPGHPHAHHPPHH